MDELSRQEFLGNQSTVNQFTVQFQELQDKVILRQEAALNIPRSQSSFGSSESSKNALP